MSTKQRGDLPARLEGVRQRFERWRQTHTPSSRLPHSLWARAVKMAATYGLHRTARTLRLDYYTLRKHVTEVAHAEPSEKGAAATFLELSPPAPSASCECTLELEDASGAKMRVQVKGMVMPDLTAISQSFWNQRP